MAFEIRVRESISLGGRSASSQTSITGEGLVAKEVAAVAAAKTGTLTTRTSDSAGELTMAASHGISTGARLDLYWTGGSRRGILVGTVSVNQVPLTTATGAGDVLPADETVITACVPTEEAIAVVGNNVVAIEYYSSKRGTIVLASSADAELDATIDGLGLLQERSQLWYESRSVTNPLAGDTVAKAFFSNGDATATATIRVQLLYN